MTAALTVPSPYSCASEWAYALRKRGLPWLRVARIMGYDCDDASAMMNASTAARMWATRRREEPLEWPLPQSEQDADYTTKGETAYTLRLRGLTWLQVARLMDYPQDDLRASQAACAIAKKWAGNRNQPWPIDRVLPSGQEVYEMRAEGMAWATIRDTLAGRRGGHYKGVGLAQLHDLAANYAQASDSEWPLPYEGTPRDPKSVRAYEIKAEDPSRTWPEVAILAEFPGEEPQRHRAAYQAARRYAMDEGLTWPLKPAKKSTTTTREPAKAEPTRRRTVIRRRGDRRTRLPALL